mmetsp:Transcript_159771/g.508597  ORF Transcript_159771/g.508597 Transcript_159771/m.508597 type:complete len:219 (-) Transcript_159771:380-1036(-)
MATPSQTPLWPAARAHSHPQSSRSELPPPWRQPPSEPLGRCDRGRGPGRRDLARVAIARKPWGECPCQSTTRPHPSHSCARPSKLPTPSRPVGHPRPPTASLPRSRGAVARQSGSQHPPGPTALRVANLAVHICLSTCLAAGTLRLPQCSAAALGRQQTGAPACVPAQRTPWPQLGAPGRRLPNFPGSLPRHRGQPARRRRPGRVPGLAAKVPDRPRS